MLNKKELPTLTTLASFSKKPAFHIQEEDADDEEDEEEEDAGEDDYADGHAGIVTIAPITRV